MKARGVIGVTMAVLSTMGGACSSPDRDGGAAVAEGGEGAFDDAVKQMGASARQGSFALNGAVQLLESESTYTYACSELDMTGRLLTPRPGAMKLELASGGSFLDLDVVADDRGLSVVSRDSSQVWALLSGDCCERLVIRDIAFSRVVTREDGTLTSFEMDATGHVRRDTCPDWYGDVSEEYAMTLHGVAHVDEQRPRFVEGPRYADPLAPATARFSEVLTAEAAVSFSLDGVTSVPVRRGVSALSGDFWSLSVPPPVGLDLALGWGVVGTDASGNTLDSSWRTRTPPDPGILPQDGFEADVPSLWHKPVLEKREPISGKRSLLIDTDDLRAPHRIDFHLARGTGAVLRFSTRELGWNNDEAPLATLHVLVGVIGNQQLLSYQLPDSRLDPEDDIPQAPPEPVEHELVLPAGGDVLVGFELRANGSSCDDLDCLPSVMPTLVDDLRIE